MHPSYEEHLQREKRMDFYQLIKEIPDPFQGIVRQLLAGESINRIAQSRNRSERTVYRWIEQSIELIKKMLSPVKN